MTDHIQIIFQDIDGCLNPANGEAFGATPGWQLSSEQIEMLHAIDQALEASTVEHFVFNTGRPWYLVQCIAEHIHSPKLRYFLLEHACILYDRETDCYLDCKKIAAAAGLSDLADRYANLKHLHILFDWYRTKGQQELEARYQAPLPALDKAGNLSFKIPDNADGDALLQEFEALAKAQLPSQHTDHLEFMRSDLYIDILPGIHKLDGVHLLAAYLNVDLNHALAVGDYLNDLQIFEAFPQVFCPANAHEKIRELTQQKGTSGIISSLSYGPALLELLQNMKSGTS